MKCSLRKVYRQEGLEGGLRTESVIGDAQDPPVGGKPFIMVAEPIQEGFDFRYIETSKVVSVDSTNCVENKTTFTTESGSVYEVEVLS